MVPSMRTEIDQIAERLGVTDEARRKWRARGAVPHRWRFPILAEAGKSGVLLTFDDMQWATATAAQPPAAEQGRAA